MVKTRINKKAILLAVCAAAVLIAGCARVVDADGHTLEEKIIYLTTTWGSIWQNEGLITFLFVYPLSQCINFLSKYMNVALAIVITTMLLHLILMPVSIKSTVASQKMQMLQPELNKIQAKYANRNDAMAQNQQAAEMQNLYNKYGINPLSSMILPFIQLPIILSMYYAVQRAAAVVNGTIFGTSLSTTPAHAFANIKTEWPLIVIFILMGGSQFLATKVPQWLAAKANKKNHKVKSYSTQKQPDNPMGASGKYMMYVMVVMIMFLGWKWPIAMSLYWLISSAVNTIKTMVIQRRYIDNAKA